MPEKRQILEEFLFSFNHEKFSKKEKVELIKEMFEKDEFNIKVFLVTKDRTEENKTENIEALKRYIMFNDLKDELITNSVKTKKNKV